MIRAGVHDGVTMNYKEITSVSIPILHVGVQNTAEGCIYCGHQFQFPYCTWEFKKPAGHKSGGREVSIPILHVGVQSGNAQAPSQAGAFQFPYCTWEFNTQLASAMPILSSF